MNSIVSRNLKPNKLISVPDDRKWQRHAKEGHLRKAILALVESHHRISFHHLQEKLSPYFPARGHAHLEIRGVVVWIHLSKDLANALAGLIHRRAILLVPGDPDSIYGVSVAEGAFCDFTNFRRLAFCGPTKFGVSRWARHAV
jgi:hypothetical protein